MVNTRGERKQGCNHHRRVLKVSVMFFKAVVSTWLLIVSLQSVSMFYKYIHTHIFFCRELIFSYFFLINFVHYKKEKHITSTGSTGTSIDTLILTR